MKITLLTDNPRNWFVPFANRLHRKVEVLGDGVARACSIEEVDAGDCLFLKSCEEIENNEIYHQKTAQVDGQAVFRIVELMSAQPGHVRTPGAIA